MYVIIAGAGKVGRNLASELISKDHEVTLIESSRARYLTMEEDFEHAVQYGDATELWVLERAGIQRADLVIAVTGDDEDNILVCQVAKADQETWVRARHVSHSEILVKPVSALLPRPSRFITTFE